MRKYKLLFTVLSMCFISSIGISQECTDTIKYVSYKSSKLINLGKQEPLSYMGKIMNGDAVSQSFINNDVITVKGVSIRMAGYRFEKAKYTLSTEELSVKVYLQEVDPFTFMPTKKIDSTEVQIKEDKFYFVSFKKSPSIGSNFSITIKNNTAAPSINLKYALRVYANNASSLQGGYGEALGFVTAANKTLSNRDYFESCLPSSTNGAGFITGSKNEQIIDWDYYVYPVISYSISPQVTSTNIAPENNSNVELTRMNKLSIGSNHMLSYSGFSKRYYGTKDSTYIWNIKGKKILDSTYNFTYYNGDDLGTYTVSVKGYTSYCKSTIKNKDIVNCELKSQISSIKEESGLGKKDGGAYISVSGGKNPYTYQWSTLPIQTSNTLTNVTSGFYYVSVIDDNVNHCQLVDSVYIKLGCDLAVRLDKLENEIGLNNKNGSIKIEVTGGSLPYVYSWNNGFSTASIYNLSKGNYDVTVTDKNGCKVSKNYEIALCDMLISKKELIEESYKGKSDGSASITVTGGNLPYTYSWSTIPVQNTPKATSLASGSYSLLVKDAKGCQLIESVVINLKCNLVTSVELISLQSSIDKKDGSAVVKVSGGKSPIVFSWNSTPIQKKDTLIGVGAGKYIVTVTDANSCIYKDSVEIKINNSSCQLKVKNVYIKPESYKGTKDGKAYVEVTGGNQYQFEWSTIPVQMTDTAHSLGAGTYLVTVKDEKQCILIHKVNINLLCDLTLNLSKKDETIVNKKDGFAIVKITGSNSPFSIIWNNNSTYKKDTLLNIGKGVYKVEVTDSKGCKLSDSIKVNTTCDLKLKFEVSLLSEASKNNGSIQADVIGGVAPFNYLWNNGKTSNVLTDLKKGSYNLTVTDKNKCKITDSVFVGVANLMSINSLLFDVYPNPIKEILTVNISDQTLIGDIHLNLIDFTGKLVYNEILNSSTLENKTQLNVSDLLPGIYFIEIENNGRYYKTKLVKE